MWTQSAPRLHQLPLLSHPEDSVVEAELAVRVVAEEHHGGLAPVRDEDGAVVSEFTNYGKCDLTYYIFVLK